MYVYIYIYIYMSNTSEDKAHCKTTYISTNLSVFLRVSEEKPLHASLLGYRKKKMYIYTITIWACSV